MSVDSSAPNERLVRAPRRGRGERRRRTNASFGRDVVDAGNVDAPGAQEDPERELDGFLRFAHDVRPALAWVEDHERLEAHVGSLGVVV
jgi:hypothetical protein